MQEENVEALSQDAGKTGEVEELKNDVKRVAADFDNYKKRVEKEKKEVALLERKKVLQEVLELLDAFESASKEFGKSSMDESSKLGIQLIGKAFGKLLESHKVKRMVVIGKKFDPLTCECVAIAGGKEDGIVLEEVRAGFFLEDFVLRPAAVVVSRKEQEGVEKAVENKK